MAGAFMALILVIDDDPAVLKTLSAGLKRNGHDTIEALNGREAAAMLRNATVDLVVTDILMPERDGLEVIMGLLQQNPNLPVIAISGLPIDVAPYLSAAKKLGARRALVKPFHISELVRAIDSVLAEAKAPPPAVK
jgi:CheY-like chemotaxis protein